MRGLIKSDLAYPELWNSCVGAWCPSVDRSRGTSLTDWSPCRNHGTLTNMDAETDWVVSGGRGALDFDGINDYIALPTTVRKLSGNFSLVFDVFARGVTAEQYLASDWSGPGRNFILRFNASSLDLFIGDGGINQDSALSTSISSNTSYSIVAVIRGTTKSLFLNGAQAANATGSYSGGVTSNAVNIMNDSFGFTPCAGVLFEARFYNRTLTPTEIQLLARRRGIAYETRRNRNYKAPAAGGTNRRRRIICGANC